MRSDSLVRSTERENNDVTTRFSSALVPRWKKRRVGCMVAVLILLILCRSWHALLFEDPYYDARQFPESTRQKKIVLTTTLPRSEDENGSLPTFPRWTTAKIHVNVIVEAMERAYDNNTTAAAAGSGQFHIIHVLDSKYELHSVALPNLERAAFRWGRARAVMDFVGRPAALYIQKHPPQFPSITAQLQRKADGGGLVMLANYADSQQCASYVPILGLSAPLHCPTAWPVPNYELVKLALLRRYQPRRFRHHRSSWRDLIPRVIWRGSPTGRPDIDRNARIALCVKALEFPHLVDAKLTFDAERFPFTKEMANISLITTGERTTFTNHRAVLDTDGNSWVSLVL